MPKLSCRRYLLKIENVGDGTQGCKRTNSHPVEMRFEARLVVRVRHVFLKSTKALAQTSGQEQETARAGRDDSDRLAAPNLISASDNANAEILPRTRSMRPADSGAGGPTKDNPWVRQYRVLN